MKRFSRVLIAALATLALCAPIAHGDSNHKPRVTAQAATGVTQTSAFLNSNIDPRDDDGLAYRFHYGAGSYSTATAWYSFSGDVPRDVSIQVTGLTAGTTYQFRVEAWNDDGQSYGDKRTFPTTKATAKVPGAPTAEPIGTSVPEPVLGETVVAEAASGTVLVKVEGSSEFISIEDAATIPVNSTLDTTQGTVVLQTALSGGESQSGTFWGGMFQIRQSSSGKGMTKISLRGGDFSSCREGTASRSAGKLPRRQLWSKDKGGRFKTSAKGSVATVRGTSWYTADRCDGTLTKVKHGAVKVRERGTGRSKLLKAGQSFLARFPR